VSGEPSIASWEEAVRWFRADAKNGSAILDNYFDLPVERAATRYAASSEFRAIRQIIGRGPGLALDVGAGHGIASFALATLEWDVIALDPDPSAVSDFPCVSTALISCSAARSSTTSATLTKAFVRLGACCVLAGERFLLESMLLTTTRSLPSSSRATRCIMRTVGRMRTHSIAICRPSASRDCRSFDAGARSTR
jgi:hypothetical protein